jgi:O-glycosyl hydrolase
VGASFTTGLIVGNDAIALAVLLVRFDASVPAATLPAVRIAALTASALAAVLAVAGAQAKGQAQRTAAQSTDVVVDLQAKRQVIQGFGTSSRVWTDPHLANAADVDVPTEAQTQILTSLYRRLGLTRVRNVLDNGLQQRPGAPLSFEGKRADGHIAFVKQARRFGLTTFFPGPVYLEDWMRPENPSAYVDWAMAMLQRWRVQGLEPALYAPLNEPQIARDFPPQWMHDVVIQLGKRLRAAGFKTKLVIPDDENPTDAYRRAVAVLDDPNARQYVAALAYHVYRWDTSEGRPAIVKMRQLASQHKLPVWMTEYSTSGYKDWRSSFEWAERMHVLLTDGGVNAIDYMWGYFGDWVRTDTLISIDFDHGVYRGHSPTPLYWLTGQYSRFVRPGFVRVSATGSRGTVLTSAYRSPNRAIVVATNPSSTTQTVRIAVTGGKLKGLVRPVRSSPTEQWRSLPPMAPRGGRFTVKLPPQSVTTYSAAR